MKWKLEYITKDSVNILFDDDKSNIDSEAVGIGLPHALAERLVRLHNETIENIINKVNDEP